MSSGKTKDACDAELLLELQLSKVGRLSHQGAWGLWLGKLMAS